MELVVLVLLEGTTQCNLKRLKPLVSELANWTKMYLAIVSLQTACRETLCLMTLFTMKSYRSIL
jgi:hypothetical protein